MNQRLNEVLSPTDLVLLATGLARQRCPVQPTGQVLTRWPLEEYLGRQAQALDVAARCLALSAAMRLGRGGQGLFDLLARLPFDRLGQEEVAQLFSAAAAAQRVGVEVGKTVQRLLKRCRSLADSLNPWRPGRRVSMPDFRAFKNGSCLGGPG